MTASLRTLFLRFLTLVLLSACSPGTGVEEEITVLNLSKNPPVEIGGVRPARVVLPADYTLTKTYPIIFMLHGYGANSVAQDVIFGLKKRVTERQFILVMPEGTKDDGGKRSWNATPECCDFDGKKVDDVAYFKGLIEEAEATYSIDPKRVLFVGHSNGGYMSYRMACELPEKISRIAVLAGSVFLDESACKGTLPVSVLHMHGTADQTVPYDNNLGEDLGAVLKVHTVGAEAAVKRWRVKAGCSSTEPAAVREDYQSGITGAETDVLRYTGCAEGIDVVLWRIKGGDHLMLETNQAFRDGILAFLLNEPN